MKENFSLKVLDLSYNKLGSDTKAFGEYLKELLIKNESGLLHLDLSHNQIKKDESNVIAIGLKENSNIYGFHFNGNEGQMNPKGFLIVGETNYFLEPNKQIKGSVVK